MQAPVLFLLTVIKASCLSWEVVGNILIASLLAAATDVVGCLLMQGWEIDFCCCTPSVPPFMPDVHNLAFPTFVGAAQELSRQISGEPGQRPQPVQQKPKQKQKQRGVQLETYYRHQNEHMAAHNTIAQALDDEFLALSSEPGCSVIFASSRAPTYPFVSDAVCAV